MYETNKNISSIVDISSDPNIMNETLIKPTKQNGVATKQIDPKQLLIASTVSQAI
jgi:hypothetical protein